MNTVLNFLQKVNIQQLVKWLSVVVVIGEGVSAIVDKLKESGYVDAK